MEGQNNNEQISQKDEEFLEICKSTTRFKQFIRNRYEDYMMEKGTPICSPKDSEHISPLIYEDLLTSRERKLKESAFIDYIRR